MSTLGRRIALSLLAAALCAAGKPLLGEAAPTPAIGSAIPAFLAPSACPAPQLFSSVGVVAHPVEGEPVPIEATAICNCNTDRECQGLRCHTGTATCLIALACDNGFTGSCRCP
jgi:hypothetical protein